MRDNNNRLKGGFAGLMVVVMMVLATCQTPHLAMLEESNKGYTPHRQRWAACQYLECYVLSTVSPLTPSHSHSLPHLCVPLCDILPDHVVIGHGS